MPEMVTLTREDHVREADRELLFESWNVLLACGKLDVHALKGSNDFKAQGLLAVPETEQQLFGFLPVGYKIRWQGEGDSLR